VNMDSLEEVKAIKSGVTRNADGICLDMPHPHRVAMTSRKHLFFFHWSNNEWKNYDKIDTTGDPIDDMCWIQSKLCVGTSKGYRLIDPITKAEVRIQDIPIGDALPCLSFAQSELLVQAGPHVGIFINVDALLRQLKGTGRSGGNQLLRRSSINWECKVTEVVRCAGYFLGLDENGIIEVIPEDRETEIVQTITESGLLHLIQGDGQILGYSSTDIYILTPAPLSQRIDECIANVRVEEAFRLIHLMNEQSAEGTFTPQDLLDWRTKAGFALLGNFQFKQAIDYFIHSSLDVRDLIYLYADVRPERLQWEPAHPSTPQKDIRDIIADNLQSKLSPMERQRMTRMERQAKVEDLYLQSLSELARLLLKFRGKTDSDATLKMYIDTALLKLNLVFHDLVKKHASPVKLPFELDELIGPGNACYLSECETLLMYNRRYKALAMLYHRRKMDYKALSVLQKVGEGAFEDADGDDGIDLTIQLLSEMNDSKALWSFAKWVLLKAPRRSLYIFTSKNRETSLKPEKILSFLKNDISSQNSDHNYFLQYLWHICVVDSVDDERLHNQLGLTILSKIEELKSKPGLSVDEESHLNEQRSRLSTFLEKSTRYNKLDLLDRCERMQLHDEALMLYKKLEYHHKVLETLIIKLSDSTSAVSYCLKASADQRQQRFLEMFKVHFSLLDSANSSEENEEILMDTLETLLEYSNYTNPVQILEAVPDTFSIQALSLYFEKIMPSNTHKYRQQTIQKNLYRMRKLQVQDELYNLHKMCYIIHKGTRCRHCKKRFQNHTVFTLHENNVYHLHCWQILSSS